MAKRPPKQTYHQRSEEYAKQVSSEIIEQIDEAAPDRQPVTDVRIEVSAGSRDAVRPQLLQRPAAPQCLGPGGAEGFRRAGRRTLDGEDRSGIIWREGKGTLPVLRFVRFPSLPAGINTGDSDPWGPGKACHIARLHGAAGNPVFRGGRYRLPGFFCIVIMESE